MFYFGWDMFPGEVIISLIVMLLLAILSFVIYFLFKNADPTKPEKGFRLVIVMLVEKVEAFTVDIMGEKFRSFAGYAIAVGGYIAFSFIFGLLGLPGPMTYLGNTLSIALCILGFNFMISFSLVIISGLSSLVSEGRLIIVGSIWLTNSFDSNEE